MAPTPRRLRHLAELRVVRVRRAAAGPAPGPTPAGPPDPSGAAEPPPAEQFRDAVRDVEPLPAPRRHVHRARVVAPVPHQRLRDDREVLRASVSDQIDVDSLLDTDESLSWRRAGTGVDVLRRLRRGHWAIQGELDLHGLRVDDAREQVVAFLRDALKRGQRCVRIVHGKGLGSRGGEPVLKGRVRAWLVQRDDVIAFCQARPAEGGAGALVVLLRPGRAPAPAPG